MKGNSPAEGFHTSWKVSAASDWHISAIATRAHHHQYTAPAPAGERDGSRRSQSVLSAPIVTVMPTSLPL